MKKQVTLCDSCGGEVGADGGAMRFNYSDARKGTKAADLCGDCAGKLAGQQVARRGRKPKQAATE